jgi:hypothetical protein
VKFRVALLTSLFSLSVLAVACGSDSKTESAEEQGTPAQAVARIAKVRTALDKAVSTYRSGDKKQADQIVGDAYLEEFEHVEGPLGKADGDLNEDLEDSIREELRDKIKAGAPPAEVQALVTEIKGKLDKAETALQ